MAGKEEKGRKRRKEGYKHRVKDGYNTGREKNVQL
jgi:hypothetical protein